MSAVFAVAAGARFRRRGAILNEAAPDDANGDGEATDAQKADEGREDLTEGGGGDHVAVAYGGDADDAPPHRRRDGSELSVALVLLDDVHD